MSRTVSENEVTEAEIERDENPLLAICRGQNLLVAGILGPFRHRNHVVPCGAKCNGHLRRNATIDEELHSLTTAGNSSPPTARAANKRHAAMSSGSSQ